MPQSLDVQIPRLDTLLEDLVHAEAEHADVIAAVAERHHRGAMIGVRVVAWKVDEPVVMRRLLDSGVDAIITDRPDLLREVLVSRDQWAPVIPLRGTRGPLTLSASPSMLRTDHVQPSPALLLTNCSPACPQLDITETTTRACGPALLPT